MIPAQRRWHVYTLSLGEKSSSKVGEGEEKRRVPVELDSHETPFRNFASYSLRARNLFANRRERRLWYRGTRDNGKERERERERRRGEKRHRIGIDRGEKRRKGWKKEKGENAEVEKWTITPFTDETKQERTRIQREKKKDRRGQIFLK